MSAAQDLAYEVLRRVRLAAQLPAAPTTPQLLEGWRSKALGEAVADAAANYLGDLVKAPQHSFETGLG